MLVQEYSCISVYTFTAKPDIQDVNSFSVEQLLNGEQTMKGFVESFAAHIGYYADIPLNRATILRFAMGASMNFWRAFQLQLLPVFRADHQLSHVFFMPALETGRFVKLVLFNTGITRK